MFQLQLNQFSGPIEKLLELIEEKKMEITDLNLAEITADFLRYISTIKNAKLDEESQKNFPRLLGDFIAVAAKLILIKSKALLPSLELTSEEESEIKDLKDRLSRYRQFKSAMNLFKNLYEQKTFSVSRPLFFNYQPVFYPAKNLNPEILEQIIAAVFRSLKELNVEFQKIEIPLIKLEEKIEEILKHIERGLTQFSEALKEKSRKEIIVLFLALLHLLRDQIIKVEQKEKFGDIIITK